ncbi:sigma-54-dependent Fis family transcriptional regulator [Massilia dura]|uniref:Sigma-54-dependent Fis family transcriptional regulator n=2 Tax=Pseudoduganella dura TaxID=321982 RepID=A0A6I3XM21_9BURK|nr:sigma-54-dependent Fis family transcriptional regulator [Pseudoduganella dura]
MFIKKLLGITSGSWEASAALMAARNFELSAARDLDHARTLLSSRTILVGIIELGAAVPAEAIDLFLREHPWVTWVAACRGDTLQDERWRRLIRDHCIDYHTFPIDPARLGHTLGHAYGFAALGDTMPRLVRGGGMKMTGNSPAITALRQRALKAARAEAPVLIWGESGTGKELVARGVHENSARRAGPFVPINCGAIPAGLIQSELFGNERGAFTGAGKARIGLIESASGGTVFLDEIGDLPLDMQANMLRFLQEKTIYRLGGNRPLAVDVRIVAASNVRLEEAVERGAFREDLFYRLNVLSLEVPALRERLDDVQPLAETFFHDYACERAAGVKGFSRAALAALRAHDWPGNVRELLNRVRRASVMAEGRLIMPEDLGLTEAGAGFTLPLNGARVQAERLAIAAGLAAGKSITLLAQELGVSRMTLYRLMAKHDIKLPPRRRA